MTKTLMEVLKECGIELKAMGNEGLFRALCPFHTEDTPSLTIYPTGTFYCFGCEKWGDALKFLIDYKNWTEKQALEYLGEDYQIARADKNKVIKVKNISKTWAFLWSAVMQYHNFLLGVPGAIKYLHDRGLTDETIERYKLGYTDGNVLNFQFAEEWSLGIEIGLITKEGRECLSHRITIPNLLEKGQADFLIGRTVTNNKPKYLGCRMPKPVLGFYEVRKEPLIMVAEGQFDLLLLRQWGYPAVILGGSHLTRANYLLFEGKKVIIVPDNDPPGMKSANTLKEKFGNNAILLDYTSLGVKDVGEIVDIPNGKERFDTLVKEQVWNTPTSKETLLPF